MASDPVPEAAGLFQDEPSPGPRSEEPLSPAASAGPLAARYQSFSTGATTNTQING